MKPEDTDPRGPGGAAPHERRWRRSPACACSISRASSRGRTAPWCWPTSAPTSSRSSGPGAGDPTRAWGPPFRDGESAYYLCVNRGKRSVTIDLGDPAGVEVAERLALSADIVLESFLPGGADRLGLGYEALSAARPAARLHVDRRLLARERRRAPPGLRLRDPGRGAAACRSRASRTARRSRSASRSRTSRRACSRASARSPRCARPRPPAAGHHVQVSLFDSQLAWLANRGSDWLVGGEEPQRLGNAHPAIVPYEAFATSDGYVIVAIGTDEQFARFCLAAGLARSGRRRALREERRCASSTASSSRRALAMRSRGVRRPNGWRSCEAPTSRAGRCARSPRPSRTRPTPSSARSPLLGSVRTVRSPIGLDGALPHGRGRPPLLGQHTDEVLAELGYDTTPARAPARRLPPGLTAQDSERCAERPGPSLTWAPEARGGTLRGQGGGQPRPPVGEFPPSSPSWPTEPAANPRTLVRLSAERSPRTLWNQGARRLMSATPREAGSDVTSLIAEEAVSYDDTGLHQYPPPATRHGKRAAARMVPPPQPGDR